MQQVTTITLNTAYDLVGCLPCVELGEVNAVQTLGLYPAGKGINVAKVLHDLGVNMAVSGFLGVENHGAFQQLFSEKGWRDDFHRIEGSTRINVKLTESQRESKSAVTDFNFSGYQVQPADWQQFAQRSLDYCRSSDIVAVCGSLPKGIKPEQFADWLSKLTEIGVKVALDSSNAALCACTRAKLWLVKPNQMELANWFGQPLNSLQQIIAAGKKLQAQGVENVVVSLGEQGALWINSQGILWAKAPQISEIVSTVGAGDSMVAGLIYGELNGFEQKKCFAFATAVACLAVTQSNVGVPSQAQLTSLIERVKIEELK